MLVVDLPAPLAALACTQSGLLHRDQLESLGRGFVRAQLAARRWMPFGPVLIRTNNGPLTAECELWAVVLAAGPPRIAALCGRTSLARSGLQRWEDGLLHVLLRRGDRLYLPSELRARVRVHESRRFDPNRDISTAPGPPRTPSPRSAIDAASWAPTPRAAAGLLAATVQQRLATPDALIAELSRAGRVRWRRQIAGILADLAGGAEALSELDFIAFCRRHGFPKPESQEARRDASGRQRYLDVRMRRRDGQIVLMEIDGGVHLNETTFWADQRRDNDLYLTGVDRMRFAAWAIRTDDPDAVRQIRAALDLNP